MIKKKSMDKKDKSQLIQLRVLKVSKKKGEKDKGQFMQLRVLRITKKKDESQFI
jgi:hypothetical protein